MNSYKFLHVSRLYFEFTGLWHDEEFFLSAIKYNCQYTVGSLHLDHIHARFKGRLVGLFQHCSRRLIVLLTPNEFFHSSPEAPRTIQARETSASEGRNYYEGIYLANPEFTEVLGSFTCHKAGTWDRFFHFPSEGRHVEDYSDTRKIQRLRQRPAC